MIIEVAPTPGVPAPASAEPGVPSTPTPGVPASAGTASEPDRTHDPARQWLGDHADDPDLAHLVRWAREAQVPQVRAVAVHSLRSITAAFAAHPEYGLAGARLAAELAPEFDGTLADLVASLGTVDGLVHQRSLDDAPDDAQMARERPPSRSSGGLTTGARGGS